MARRPKPPASASSQPTAPRRRLRRCCFGGRRWRDHGPERRARTSPASSTSTRTARCGSRVPTAPGATTVKFVKLAGTADERRLPCDRSPTCLRLPCRGVHAERPVGAEPSRVVSVADGHNAAGAVTLANAVPLGATAVEINLTAADPTDKNFLAVGPGRCDGDIDVAAQLEPRRHADRQLDHGQVGRITSDQGVLRRSGRQHPVHRRRLRLLPLTVASGQARCNRLVSTCALCLTQRNRFSRRSRPSGVR